MKEREPQWYEEARKGPFREAGFTDRAAEEVIIQVRTGFQPRKQTGPKLRLGFLAAAVILLLAGACLLREDLLGKSRQAGLFYQEVKNPDLSDTGIRKIAERVMQEQLGKKLPFESLERMEEAKQATVLFSAGKDSAMIGISTATGKVLQMNMSASLLPGEADAAVIKAAMKKMQDIGYPGEFKITRVQRFVQYGLTFGSEIQVQDSLTGDEGEIDFLNGEFDGAVLDVDQDEISEEVNQIGISALKQLRSKGSDRLKKITRQIAEGQDELTLAYTQGNLLSSFYTMGSVTLDYATHSVKAMSDMALYIPKSDDAAQLAEQDQKLLNMDNAQLLNTAVAVVNEVFGVRLQEYTLVKNKKTPGIVTYLSNETAPAIKVSYNLQGEVYSVRLVQAPRS